MGTFLRQLSVVFLALCGALGSQPALSQYTSDIDIYSGAPSDQDLPNVLFVVDTVNARPGTAGQIWIDDVRYGR